MDKDFSELVEYLDEKFQKTATKEDLKNFATKSDLEIMSSKLVSFEEFDSFKQEVKQEFAAVRESIQSLTVSVDKLVKAVDDLRVEYAAMSHQLTRHEKWIQQIAEKVGVRLEY